MLKSSYIYLEYIIITRSYGVQRTCYNLHRFVTVSPFLFMMIDSHCRKVLAAPEAWAFVYSGHIASYSLAPHPML